MGVGPHSRTGVRGGVLGGTLAVLLLIAVVGVCGWAGFWQLDRLEQRRARNAQLEEALALPPLPLNSATLQEIQRNPAAYLNRRVRVQGVYDPEGEVVLRGRSYQGRPGVHVVTPLRITGSEATVLVNRGWAPSPDAATVDLMPFFEPGMQEVHGLLRVIAPAPDDGAPLTLETGSTRVLTLRRLDLDALRARTAHPLLPVYIQQLPEPPLRQPPFRLAIPALDEGPHLSYAVQWFSFAAIAVIGFLVVALRRRT